MVSHRLGAGTVYYCSAGLGERGHEWLAGEIVARAGLEPVLTTPAGVEARRRSTGDADYLFLLNHDAERPADVELPGPGIELLTGVALDGRVELAPLGVAAIRLE